jgi:hypothetical protein
MGFISSGWTTKANDFLRLTIFPGSNKEFRQLKLLSFKNYIPHSEKKTKDITLLFAPDFLKIFIGSHLWLEIVGFDQRGIKPIISWK